MNPIDNAGSFSTSYERHRERTGQGGGGMRGPSAAQQLEVEMDASLLAEAAEEISLHHAEKAESKHAAERRKELARPRSLMSPEAIENYFEHTEEGDEGALKLLAFVKRVMGGQGDSAAHARDIFLRPTSQYLALQYALQEGARDGASERTLENIRDALDELEADHGPRIRADINTIDTATEGVPGPLEVARFQSTYVDLVLGCTTASETLRLVLKQYSETGLVAGLERLRRALGQDLAAAHSSTDTTHLQCLVQDLYHLNVAETVLEGCKKLQAQMRTLHGIRAGDVPVALMIDLVDLSSQAWVSADRFDTLTEKAGAAETVPRINFLTGIKGLLREMPTKVFTDGEQRQAVLAAAQEALDRVIEREEG